MTIDTDFEKFLENIEPAKKYKDRAIEAHTRVRDYLQTEDSQFSEHVVDSFLYGSYKRHTAEGNIKDVDIALITNFNPYNDEDKPGKVLPRLKRALNRLYQDPEATTPNRKSVQVIDPLPDDPDSTLTLDVIPVILTGDTDQKVLVPDRETDLWVESHPKGHLEFTSNLNSEEFSQGMFVPLVKIVKHWWKQHSGVEHAKPKGFWLEILVGKTFDPTKESYAAHFVQVLTNIKNRFLDYESYRFVPELNDPGLPSENLKTSMTLAEFVHFMDAVNDTLEIANEALISTDEDESSYLWNSIFGDDFPLSTSKNFDLSKIAQFISDSFAPEEQFLTKDFGFRFVRTNYFLKIDGWVTENDGFRPGYISQVKLIKKESKLLFKIQKCTVPGEFRVMWKVKNTGREAQRLGKQRGEINWDKGQKQREESTLYTGSHYVECYVIDQQNDCVAWDRIRVRIC